MPEQFAIEDFLEGFSWVPWLIAAAGGVLFLILLKSWSEWRKAETQRQVVEARSRADEDYRELQKSMWRAQKENESLSHFFTLLPEFTKQLNSPMERHQIAPLLLGILDRIFEAQQLLIFYTDKKVNQLILHVQKGLGPMVGRGLQIPFGEGQIGWVAQHQTAMNHDDFINTMRFSGNRLDSSVHNRFQTELCVPMLHEEETLGVISIGGISRHHKYEKRIAKMIADLGSIALYNNLLFRQLQEAAHSDGLTKLYNKKFFLYWLGNEIIKTEKGHTSLSIFLFDLDHFKRLNDSHGHLTGDEVLKAVGRILRDTIREEDVAARYGGEEFIIMFQNTKKEGALIAAEKIRKALESQPFTDEECRPLEPVTLSGGVSTFPDDGTQSTELIQAADEALYRAKHAGRNRIFPAESKYFSGEEDEVIVSDTQS